MIPYFLFPFGNRKNGYKEVCFLSCGSWGFGSTPDPMVVAAGFRSHSAPSK